MTDQDNDDEIRESIPCTEEGVPLGYRIDEAGRDGSGYSALIVTWRGVTVAKRRLIECTMLRAIGIAWDHAIEREKARRAKAKDARRTVHADRLREIAFTLWGSGVFRDDDDEPSSVLYEIADMIESGELP